MVGDGDDSYGRHLLLIRSDAMTSGTKDVARTPVRLVTYSVLLGLGIGLTAVGLLLWRAASVPGGVDSTAVRWTVPSALVGGLVAGIAARMGGRVRTPWRRRLSLALWSLAAAVLIIAVIALSSGPEEPADPVIASSATVLAPLTAPTLVVAAALIAVSAALYARAQPEPAWAYRTAPAAVSIIVVMPLLVLAGLPVQGWVEGRAATVNTLVSPPRQPAGVLESRLTGDEAWISDLDKSAPGQVLNTAGGVAVRSERPGGVRMLDPLTGEVRWSWQRTDLNDARYRMVASEDGTLIAATFTRSEQFPTPPQVVVLDAETGAARAQLPEFGGAPVAVTQDRVIAVEGDRVRAVDFDGEQLWSTELSNPVVSNLDLTSAGHGVLLVTTDGDQGRRSEAVDIASGEILWDRGAPTQAGPYRVVPGTDVAVTGGVGYRSLGGRLIEMQQPVSAEVVAVDLATGEEKWTTPVSVPEGIKHINSNGCQQRLDVDTDRVTFAACAESGRRVIVTGLDPASGRILWEQSVEPGDAPWGPRLQADDPMQAMADGTTVFLAPARDGYECDIVRVGPDGVERTPVERSVASRGCDAHSWIGSDQTGILTNGSSNGIIALR
ncbi:PQQ-binding-like beta-propeller repeat protein [Aeromicrobium piscarium]|uniref:PQQ-binding-like beta-propeller repeat protein n=1 Tax=Aeromicrobium piscarium TaxID=2590901 RepID=A0A554SG58_9ACTN|nr:PQQ-binding-like beta-propeller repeat protein [Aeromicrobium piscarium]